MTGSDFRPTGRIFGVGVVAVAMTLAAGLALLGLDNHDFWDDEANTAIYARNLIQRGELTAWDGTNLVGYAQGRALGDDLGQELRVPPLPAYITAGGMLLCGESNFGGRIMFVVAGVLSIGLLAIWVRRHFGPRFPWWLPSIILAISPAYLLYIRNCRYYAPGVMFTLLVWVFWSPGPLRGRLSNVPLFDRHSSQRVSLGHRAADGVGGEQAGEAVRRARYLVDATQGEHPCCYRAGKGSCRASMSYCSR